MSQSNYVHIEVDEILKETDNAFLVLYKETEVWLPKTQIADVRDYEEGDVDCTLSITEWLAKKIGVE